MKSMLQELDNNLISKDNFIHEQTAKLVERDKIIQNNKAAIERLEKKNKMQEHKVGNKNIQISKRVLTCRHMISLVNISCDSALDRHPSENDQNLRGRQAVTASGAGNQRAEAAEGAVREETHGTTDARRGLRYTAQVGERMCE